MIVHFEANIIVSALLHILSRAIKEQVCRPHPVAVVYPVPTKSFFGQRHFSPAMPWKFSPTADLARDTITRQKRCVRGRTFCLELTNRRGAADVPLADFARAGGRQGLLYLV